MKFLKSFRSGPGSRASILLKNGCWKYFWYQGFQCQRSSGRIAKLICCFAGSTAAYLLEAQWEVLFRCSFLLYLANVLILLVGIVFVA
jgi:hypothetical protein